MAPIPQTHPLRRWFAGLVEDSFQKQIGLGDPSLLDYIVDLLTEFIHVERINLLGDGSRRRIEEVAEMVSEVEIGPTATTEDRRRAVHRHIGDFTLFWTGVYPENLKRLQRKQAADFLLNYLDQGKRSYAIASRLSSDDSRPPASVLSTLSHEFEYCVYGLGLVRKEWERTDPAGLTRIDQLWR
ncbi:MAG TPA: hypothetical protein VJZ71_02725 [Phycisphaerae bacterium]|nr:hypothetical protein [Phycisphaerae bacterium]